VKPTTRTIAAIAVALLLSPAHSFGQNAKPAPAGAHPGEGTPKVELFLGYSYLRAVPLLAAGNRMETLNGGSTSIAFNLNRYFGVVGDFGGFNATELELTGAGANPAGVNNASGNALTYLAGPRLSFRKYDRVTPFAQVLVGGIHASAVTLSGCTGVLCTPLPMENAIAFTAGGGLDIKVQRHLAIRAIQAEYMATRFANLSTGYRQIQNDMRLSSGLVLRFGGERAALPVSYSCSVTPASVMSGEPASVTGTALNLNPKKTATYAWTTDGGTINGTTATASIVTAAPGTYTVHGHVSEGTRPGQSADCSASYTVMSFQPPTVACSASPSAILAGATSVVTAQGSSPQNRPLTYSYSASAGTISGSTSSATLGTAGANPGTITVTCNVVDDKGLTASANTTVAVNALPAAAEIAVATQALCTVHFERDAKRPARVDNEAKACLDDIALSLQRNNDAKVALVGNGGNDAAKRAINTRDYLVKEKGVEASRILIYTGAGSGREVDTVLIPAGARLDSTGMTPFSIP
jgi:hypothetical protein